MKKLTLAVLILFLVAAPAAWAMGPVNVNTATVEQLDRKSVV